MKKMNNIFPLPAFIVNYKYIIILNVRPFYAQYYRLCCRCKFVEKNFYDKCSTMYNNIIMNNAWHLSF